MNVTRPMKQTALVTEAQVKDLLEQAKQGAIREEVVYTSMVNGILLGLLEVASNPEEVEEYIKAWREDV